MSDTQAIIGSGSKFSIGDGAAPEVFTDVAEVTNITPPEQTVGTTDATHMQSPGKMKEVIATLGDQSAISISGNYVPVSASATALLAALVARAKKNYRITFPDGSTCTVGAIATSYKIGELTAEGKVDFTATFQPSGARMVLA